jgi:uncharacterized protein YqhQ
LEGQQREQSSKKIPGEKAIVVIDIVFTEVLSLFDACAIFTLVPDNIVLARARLVLASASM